MFGRKGMLEEIGKPRLIIWRIHRFCMQRGGIWSEMYLQYVAAGSMQIVVKSEGHSVL